MAVIDCKLRVATTFNSFFGPVVFEPGLNSQIRDPLWRNLKANNPDVKALLAKGLLVEVEAELKP
ncbi:MAG: hypothetical protein MH252_13890 [Thermosynechococcaceae cyanobacterium MS004]|nr:hypothetical protein [Thermosynechococcaceae cyanobacterium MS004]